MTQDIDYSEALNAYRTVISTPFWKASFILGWPIESAGFGIADHLIEKCRAKTADLIVFCEFNQMEYRMDILTLLGIVETWNVRYYKSVNLTVLPINLFSPFKQSEAETCKCHCGCPSVVQTGYFLCPNCVRRCLA